PPPQPTVRHAHGQRADATFRTDGQIAGVTLLEQVTYGDGEVNATGDRAAMDMDAGRGDFFGNPVHVVSPRGEMRAPHVIYTSADQLVHAVEEVHAVIQQSGDANLAGGVLGEGKGPVMVQSAEAFWLRPQASFVFRGDVRAWRGDNILLAPELVGERLAQGDQLAAAGGVKTVWIPGQEEGSPQSGTAAKPAPAGPAAPGAAGASGNRAAGGAPPRAAGTAAGAADAGRGGRQGNGPITVLASNMLYRDGSGVLTYSGNVHVDQEGKTLSCKQLDVNLDQDHKAKQMTCTGGTHLDDPATGRKIDGETGVYGLETRKIDVFGDPVVMHDRDGNLVHGKRLRYALDDGKVEVLGKDEVRPPAPAGAAVSPARPEAAAGQGAGAPGGGAGSGGAR
ncbi:MAG TPA: LptA/OstA family protein, partial [Thermoanaerobaculia bacterium]|nr:LptA/OstA family protein [Thermoanaerobaculia bacterium]